MSTSMSERRMQQDFAPKTRCWMRLFATPLSYCNHPDHCLPDLRRLAADALARQRTACCAARVPRITGRVHHPGPVPAPLLPLGILSLLSPAAADFYARFSLPGTGRHRISIYPGATRVWLFNLLAYSAVFTVIINHYRTRE